MLRIAVFIVLIILLLLVLLIVMKKTGDWLNKPAHMWLVVMVILSGFGFFLVLALQESGERIPYVPFDQRQLNTTVPANE